MLWILDGLKERKNSKDLAVVNRFESITFEELWTKSEQIARDIVATGKNTPVVIYGDKNINIIPTMVAALKTGRAYVPVDITFPVERLAYIASTVDACVIYNYSEIPLDLPFNIKDENYVRKTLYCTEFNEDLNEENWVKNEDPCYILFTSGSTGAPKGVPINKANILNLIAYTYEFLDFNLMGNHICIPVSFSFDMSIPPIHILLPQGKTMYCIDKTLLKDNDVLVNWLIENDITYTFGTPSFIDMCQRSSNFNGNNLPNYKLAVFGGEILPKQLVRKLWDNFPGITVMNVYGPTEASVYVSDCVVTEEMIEDSRSIPIGRMMKECTWYIESPDGRHCKDNEHGELVYISKSVSTGYFNDPERSKKAFFKASDGKMGYKSGDTVFSDNGYIYFVGRKDFQIKLSGYRIDIDDVSNNLDKVSIVKRNAIIPAYNSEGVVEYLAAFVTLEDGYVGSTLQTVIKIKKELSEYLPSYMLPRKIIIVEDFALNTNGKIDRKVLAKMLENKGDIR